MCVVVADEGRRIGGRCRDGDDDEVGHGGLTTATTTTTTANEHHQSTCWSCVYRRIEELGDTLAQEPLNTEKIQYETVPHLSKTFCLVLYFTRALQNGGYIERSV